MENIASYINESQENGTFLKFPFWQPTLAVWAITILLVNPTIVAIDLTLLVTMLKTKNLRRNPLNLIHMSILVSQIASRLTFLIGYATYMLPAWRDCSCSIFLNSFVLSLYIFLSAYDPIAFAFLSCLQLLQVKGKKRLRKSATISVCFSIACSMIFGIEFIAFQAKYDFRDLLVCSQVCASDQQMRTFSIALVSATIPVFLTLLPLVLIPSLITVIITAIWSCAIFKNSYTGGNDQLNKRMLSIPLIMPIVITATNVFVGYPPRVLISEILPTVPFRRYWIIFFQIEYTLIFDGFSGFFYPLLLLYLMPPLRQALRKSNATVVPAD